MENVFVNPSIQLAKHIQYHSNFEMAKQDFISGLKNIGLWHYLALTDIRRRYKRTVIGPFWTSLSLGIFVLCMGVLLSGLWGTDPKTFLPYFCSGYVCWILMSTIIGEGCQTFIANATFMKQLAIPYFTYTCLITWRNLIVFAHHLVILALVMIYCGKTINTNIVFIIPGLCIFFITSVFLCMLLGMICARFRDVKQIIDSTLQLIMFVTPIMWSPGQLGRKGVILTNINPVYHYLSLIRLPLIGEAPELKSWLICLILTTLLGLFTFVLLSKKYRNIIYWL